MPKGHHTGKRGPKRTPAAKTQDQAKIAQMLRQGMTQTMIAEKIGISQGQVSYDWKIIVKNLTSQMTADTKALVALKLEEFGQVKVESWLAWYESREKMVEELAAKIRAKVLECRDEDTGEVDWSKLPEIRVEAAKGPQVQFLQTIVSCLNAERELQGLNPAKEIKGKVDVTSVSWDILASAIPETITDEVEAEIIKALGTTSSGTMEVFPPSQLGLKELGSAPPSSNGKEQH